LVVDISEWRHVFSRVAELPDRWAASERITIRLVPNRGLEIHDSRLESLVVSDGHVVLDFSAAYIHESDGRPSVDAGTVWTQHAVIRVRGDVITGSRLELPCDLSSGRLILNGKEFDNLIPISLSSDGNVELHFTSQLGESVQIRGDRVILALLGERNFVEDFPGPYWV
jgi:hypothetical protein